MSPHRSARCLIAGALVIALLLTVYTLGTTRAAGTSPFSLTADSHGLHFSSHADYAASMNAKGNILPTTQKPGSLRGAGSVLPTLDPTAARRQAVETANAGVTIHSSNATAAAASPPPSPPPLPPIPLPRCTPVVEEGVFSLGLQQLPPALRPAWGLVFNTPWPLPIGSAPPPCASYVTRATCVGDLEPLLGTLGSLLRANVTVPVLVQLGGYWTRARPHAVLLADALQGAWGVAVQWMDEPPPRGHGPDGSGGSGKEEDTPFWLRGLNLTSATHAKGSTAGDAAAPPPPLRNAACAAVKGGLKGAPPENLARELRAALRSLPRGAPSRIIYVAPGGVVLQPLEPLLQATLSYSLVALVDPSDPSTRLPSSRLLILDLDEANGALPRGRVSNYDWAILTPLQAQRFQGERAKTVRIAEEIARYLSSAPEGLRPRSIPRQDPSRGRASALTAVPMPYLHLQFHVAAFPSTGDLSGQDLPVALALGGDRVAIAETEIASAKHSGGGALVNALAKIQAVLNMVTPVPPPPAPAPSDRQDASEDSESKYASFFRTKASIQAASAKKQVEPTKNAAPDVAAPFLLVYNSDLPPWHAPGAQDAAWRTKVDPVLHFAFAVSLRTALEGLGKWAVRAGGYEILPPKLAKFVPPQFVGRTKDPDGSFKLALQPVLALLQGKRVPPPPAAAAGNESAPAPPASSGDPDHYFITLPVLRKRDVQLQAQAGAQVATRKLHAAADAIDRFVTQLGDVTSSLRGVDPDSTDPDLHEVDDVELPVPLLTSIPPPTLFDWQRLTDRCAFAFARRLEAAIARAKEAAAATERAEAEVDNVQVSDAPPDRVRYRLDRGSFGARPYRVLLLGYSRVAELSRTVHRYASCPGNAGIIVVWNHETDEPPVFNLTAADGTPAQATVSIVRPGSKNSMNNRWAPTEDQDGLPLVIADDDLFVSCDHVAWLVRVWYGGHRDALVGPVSRGMMLGGERGNPRVDAAEMMDPEDLRYVMNRFPHNHLSTSYAAVLTKLLVVDPLFLLQYSCLAPPVFLESVEQTQNCEDLAMNAVVAGATGQAPVFMGLPSGALQDVGGDAGAIWRRRGHTELRHGCLKDFARAIGDVPFVERADAITDYAWLQQTGAIQTL